MPPQDKIREWVVHRYRFPDCEFESAAEFEWLRHMQENPCHVIGPIAALSWGGEA
jgi:hypothetical protein